MAAARFVLRQTQASRERLLKKARRSLVNAPEKGSGTQTEAENLDRIQYVAAGGDLNALGGDETP